MTASRTWASLGGIPGVATFSLLSTWSKCWTLWAVSATLRLDGEAGPV